MIRNEKETKDVLSFVKEFNDILPSDLENILEYLDDSGLLNEDGKQFRTILWELFVKDHEYIIIPEESGGYSGREGAGEAYHIGIFGKTGSGKSVLAKMILVAYANTKTCR